MTNLRGKQTSSEGQLIKNGHQPPSNKNMGMNELISSFPIEFDSIVNIKMIEVTSKILRNGHLNIWFQDSPIQPWVAHWKAWRVVGFIVSPPKEVELYHLCQRFDHPTLIPNL